MHRSKAPWLVMPKPGKVTVHRRLLGCDTTEHEMTAGERSSVRAPSVPLWETAATRMRQWGLEELAASHHRLEQRVEALEAKTGDTVYVIPITSFAPRPYGLRRDIPIVVRMISEDEYLAAFADAGITASGDTQHEAFEGVRSLILDLYEHLKGIPADKRGPRLVSQLAVLRDFIIESP